MTKLTLREIVEEDIVGKARRGTQNVEVRGLKRGRKKKNFYFTQETENAIILYNKFSWTEETCLDALIPLLEERATLDGMSLTEEQKREKIDELDHGIRRLQAQLEYTRWLYSTFSNHEIEHWKNYIYREYIQYPLEKIVENMYNKYKLSYFDAPPEHVQAEAVHNLLLNLTKYDESKGTKAFSYFTVVAKHHLMQVNNGNHRRYKRSSLMSSMPDNWEVEDDFHQRVDDSEMLEFKKVMLEFWDNKMTTIFTKKKDRQIADAILELFRRSDSIENFNKKHLYLLIREMADCKTQHITRVVNIMRDTQVELLDTFRESGDIETVGEEFEDSFLW